MFKSCRKQFGSLESGMILMSNILLWKSAISCVAFHCAFVTFARLMLLCTTKYTVHVRNFFIETAQQIKLVCFRLYMEVSPISSSPSTLFKSTPLKQSRIRPHLYQFYVRDGNIGEIILTPISSTPCTIFESLPLRQSRFTLTFTSFMPWVELLGRLCRPIQFWNDYVFWVDNRY